MESYWQIKTTELFDLDQTIAKDIFLSYTFPWEVLSSLKDKIRFIVAALNQSEYREVAKEAWVHKSCKIAKSAMIEGPCLIGQNTEIRHGAYIRGSVIIGENCIIGNSTEVKNSILFNKVKASHFNYIGDSIVGYSSHLGAGAIFSNLRVDKLEVSIKLPTNIIETGLKKFGAAVGDFVELGCNCVLNPGTIIGKNCRIAPLMSLKGVIQSGSTIK